MAQDVVADMKARCTLGKDSEEEETVALVPKRGQPYSGTPRKATKLLDSHLQLSPKPGQSQGQVQLSPKLGQSQVKCTARS